MEVQEHATGAHLYLYGDFGDSSSTSKIRINDQLLTEDPASLNGHIISWSPNLIVTGIQTATSGIGHGKVSVLNKGGESNKRTLNVWEGDIIYSRPDQGSLKTDIRFHVYLRADADPHPPINYLQPRTSSFASPSEAHYSVGGEGSSLYNSGGCQVNMTMRWAAASGKIPVRIPFKNTAGVPEYFQVKLKFKNRKFEVQTLDVWKNKVTTKSMTVVACGPPSVSNGHHILSSVHSKLQDFNMEFESENSKVIKAGNITAVSNTESGLVWDNGSVPSYTATISWSRMVPKYQ